MNTKTRPPVHLWWPRSRAETLAALGPGTEIIEVITGIITDWSGLTKLAWICIVTLSWLPAHNLARDYNHDHHEHHDHHQDHHHDHYCHDHDHLQTAWPMADEEHHANQVEDSHEKGHWFQNLKIDFRTWKFYFRSWFDFMIIKIIMITSVTFWLTPSWTSWTSCLAMEGHKLASLPTTGVNLYHQIKVNIPSQISYSVWVYHHHHLYS